MRRILIRRASVGEKKKMKQKKKPEKALQIEKPSQAGNTTSHALQGQIAKSKAIIGKIAKSHSRKEEKLRKRTAFHKGKIKRLLEHKRKGRISKFSF